MLPRLRIVIHKFVERALVDGVKVILTISTYGSTRITVQLVPAIVRVLVVPTNRIAVNKLSIISQSWIDVQVR